MVRLARHVTGFIETGANEARTAIFPGKTADIVRDDEARQTVNGGLNIERLRVRRPLSRTLC
jgi:hypothetical protein